MIKTENSTKSVYGVIIVIVILAIMSGVVWFFRSPASSVVVNGPDMTLPQPMVLHNDKYGFEITAPAGAEVTSTFKKYYVLGDSWRINAPEGSVGEGLLSIPVLQVDTKDADPKVYPLYFNAEVRIGVSSNTTACYDKDKGYTNQKVADVTINGIKFKKFTFGDAAMMQYVEGESYRTIHEGLCFVVEKVKTGSSYREAGMEEALSDKDLAEYYAQTDDAIKTFKFTN